MIFDKGFTRNDLVYKKGTDATPEDKFSGRSLTDRALAQIANYRLALKYYDEYMKPDGTFPSGKGLEDVLLYVRQKMYVKLRGAKNNRSNSRRNNKKEEGKFTEEDMPSGYMFNGWFAFVCVGPQGLSSQTLGCLAAGDNAKQTPKQSRAALRAADATRKTAERTADERATGPTVYRRGTTMEDNYSCATLAANHVKEEARNIRELLVIANNNEGNCLKLLTALDKMLDGAQARHQEAAVKSLMERQGDCLRELDRINKRKRDLEQKSDALMAASTKKQVKAYYDQVGIGFNDDDEDHVPQVVRVDDGATATSTATGPSNLSFGRATLCDKNDRDCDRVMAKTPKQQQPAVDLSQDSSPESSTNQGSTNQGSKQGSSSSSSSLRIWQSRSDDEQDEEDRRNGYSNGGVTMGQPTQPTQPSQSILPYGNHATAALMEQYTLTADRAQAYYAGEEEEV